MNTPRIPLVVSALAAAALTTASSVGAAECTRPGDNAVVSWKGAAHGSDHVRAYFRSDEGETEHFVEMSQETATTLRAVLPKVSAGTSKIQYRIASVNDRAEKALFSGQITVSDSCAARVETKSADRLVVGSTSDSILPSGFECDGIVGTVSRRGDLRAYRGCRNETSLSPSGSSRTALATKNPNGTKLAGKKSSNESVNGGNGHVDHGEGKGLGHCKDRGFTPPGRAKDPHPECAAVSSPYP